MIFMLKTTPKIKATLKIRFLKGEDDQNMKTTPKLETTPRMRGLKVVKWVKMCKEWKIHVVIFVGGGAYYVYQDPKKKVYTLEKSLVDPVA